MKGMRVFGLGCTVVMLLGATYLAVVAQSDERSTDHVAGASGADYASMVMAAWDTQDIVLIETTYAPDVVMVLDQSTVASDRDEIIEVIRQARGLGNTYRQVGEVVAYEASDGDLYVGTIVEVAGVGHPSGVPVVGFYRVRDGKVIRHVFLDAEHY